MKHRLSLCFRHARFCCVFARDWLRIYAISGENPDFACFSHSQPISDFCPRAAAVTHAATSRGNARPAIDRRTNPKDERKTRGVGEGMGSSLRAAVRHKSRHGRRPPVWMQDEDEKRFHALQCNGEARGARKRREFTRGAVEDIERRGLLFV